MKRNYLGIIASVLFAFSCTNPTPQKKNIKISKEEILAQISEPEIKDYSIMLTDYDGNGDSLTDNKVAFDKAIKHLSEKGGGKLVVPKGQYLVNGPIHLESNIELHLDENARVFFGSNPSDYLPVVKTSWEGTFIYNYSPFIYAYNCSNIVISGKGIIDGEASNTWSLWKEKQKPDQQLSREMNHNNTPVEDRIFGEGHYLRPHLIQFFDCEKLKIEGVKIEDSPFWCIHILRCENVIVRNVKYAAFNKNNDGIDPEYSRNILIENITFNNSDDNVAIKAGRDDEGRASEYCSENIIVRNCLFKGLHALVIGSEMSAGVKNVFVYDCGYAGYLKRGIYLKSNPDRGGFIKNISVKNVQFGKVEDCFYITSFYHNEGKGYATEISNVLFENISCDTALNNGIVIQGFPEKKVHDITFTNIKLNQVKNPLSLTATENIVFNDIIIGSEADKPSYVK